MMAVKVASVLMGSPLNRLHIRQSWRAAADAIGHCLVVFTFLPVVAAVPGWVWSEARNPLNTEEPVVLAFLPVRGFVALLDAFGEGVFPGALAGIVAGGLLTAWVLRRRDRTTGRERLAGAVCGALGAGVVVVTAIVNMVLSGHDVALPAVPIAFEVGSAVVCGAVAARTAVRLAAAGRDAWAPADVRPAAS